MEVVRMNKTKIIAGLNMIIEALDEDNSVSIAEAPVKETVTQSEPVIGKLNEDELRKMKYNELKSLASKLGVNCKGTREEVIKRLMALNTIDPNEVAEEPVEEDKSEHKKSKKSQDFILLGHLAQIYGEFLPPTYFIPSLSKASAIILAFPL